MRVLVCGSRYWTDQTLIFRRLRKFPKWTVILHGAAKGADSIAGRIARQLGMRVEVYPAKWESYKRGAGPVRNQKMLETKPDLVLAFHDDLASSRGTKDMLSRAEAVGVPVEIISH